MLSGDGFVCYWSVWDGCARVRVGGMDVWDVIQTQGGVQRNQVAHLDITHTHEQIHPHVHEAEPQQKIHLQMKKHYKQHP